jgi:hypothetical protein
VEIKHDFLVGELVFANFHGLLWGELQG